MNISWGACVQMMENRRPIPLGVTIEYEFRPSTSYYVEGYSVCAEYYKLSKEEYTKAREARLKQLHTKWNKSRANDPRNFSWQQFKLIDKDKKVLILRMNREGHVDALVPKIIQVPVEILELAPQ